MQFKDVKPGVTIQNRVCTWEILSVPEYHTVNTWLNEPIGRVRAICRFKNGSHAPKEVWLKCPLNSEVRGA